MIVGLSKEKKYEEYYLLIGNSLWGKVLEINESPVRGRVPNADESLVQGRAQEAGESSMR